MSALPGVALSFAVMLYSDFLKRRGRAKQGGWVFLAGMAILTASLVLSVFLGGWFPAALPQRVVFLLLSGIAGAMVFISLFVSLPARQTYLVSEQPPLAEDGMYALCRHPAALFLPFFLLCGAAGLGSSGLMAAGAAASALNILYVWLQDRYIFPVTIPGYADYRRRVPFLLPTRESVRTALHGRARNKDKA